MFLAVSHREDVRIHLKLRYFYDFWGPVLLILFLAELIDSGNLHGLIPKWKTVKKMEGQLMLP